MIGGVHDFCHEIVGGGEMSHGVQVAGRARGIEPVDVEIDRISVKDLAKITRELCGQAQT
jgi:hypothetical protein